MTFFVLFLLPFTLEIEFLILHYYKYILFIRRKQLTFRMIIKFNKNIPDQRRVVERLTFFCKRSYARDVGQYLGVVRSRTDSKAGPSFLSFFPLLINIHIQECAHFSAAEHDKGKRFQWWILVCVWKFHACEVGLIARETEVLLFLHKQLQCREPQCECPSRVRPGGMTGVTSQAFSGLSSES